MKIKNVTRKCVGVSMTTLITLGALQGCTSADSAPKSSTVSNEKSRVEKPFVDTIEKVSSGLTQVAYKDLATLSTSPPSSVITYGDDPLQRIYHWQAAGVNERLSSSASAVIYIHGGCWLNAYDYKHANGFYHALQEKGMNVYAVEYRRTGDDGGGWPGSLNDVKSGIETALKHIAVKNQHSNVFVVGHSAGGHLALLSTDVLQKQYDGLNINAVVGLAAITDITSYANGDNSCQSATSSFMAATPEQAPAAYFDATPVITNVSLPVVLLQGDADSIVPQKHASLDGAKAVIIANGGHFDWLHSQSTSFNALLSVFGEHNE